MANLKCEYATTLFMHVFLINYLNADSNEKFVLFYGCKTTRFFKLHKSHNFGVILLNAPKNLLMFNC